MIAKDIFDGVAALSIRTIGRLADYKPRVGYPISEISVDFVSDSEAHPVGFESTVLEPETTIEYIFADIGKEVDVGDRFRVYSDAAKTDYDDWTVKAIRENDGRTVKVAVKNEN